MSQSHKEGSTSHAMMTTARLQQHSTPSKGMSRMRSTTIISGLGNSNYHNNNSSISADADNPIAEDPMTIIRLLSASVDVDGDMDGDGDNDGDRDGDRDGRGHEGGLSKNTASVSDASGHDGRGGVVQAEEKEAKEEEEEEEEEEENEEENEEEKEGRVSSKEPGSTSKEGANEEQVLTLEEKKSIRRGSESFDLFIAAAALQSSKTSPSSLSPVAEAVEAAVEAAVEEAVEEAVEASSTTTTITFVSSSTESAAPASMSDLVISNIGSKSVTPTSNAPS
eukprot:CAMPEP_0175054584 /NCGR_PEP_ID=MMETSP0052_2-20121109/9585_1 /TAXON_ID=51329 ORGANISM="Polytomella parva, Strain SAG 63-3" /NCGR_SAMPLE_ID=MMETSP0052_2 /ASSEMBLY_ACC=CAM_ASM_000194 /LENGTH=279 /DNA_ID=CAMNT_0016319293 /DNA_START=1 /DNA_END=836 /DNA_ORIENTATION=-